MKSWSLSEHKFEHLAILARLLFELEAIEGMRLLNREIVEVEDVVVFFVAH